VKGIPYAPYAPFYDWTGFYLGANIGYGWTSASGTITNLQVGPEKSLQIVAVAVVALPIFVVGLFLRRPWARNFWLRLAHLLFIGFVVGETAIGGECPFTTWERQLREADGASLHEVDAQPCLARFAHRTTFMDNKTIEDMLPYYVAFGLLVVLSWLLGPPKWPRKKPGPTLASGPGNKV